MSPLDQSSDKLVKNVSMFNHLTQDEFKESNQECLQMPATNQKGILKIWHLIIAIFICIFIIWLIVLSVTIANTNAKTNEIVIYRCPFCKLLLGKIGSPRIL